MNYTTSDKEMLAIVQTLKKFRHLLQGTKFRVIVKSDHKNLRTFMTTKELNARQARWAEELSSYDFKIEHIKRKENRVADALSRRADYKEKETPERKIQMLIEEDGALIINQQMKLNMISSQHRGWSNKKRNKGSNRKKRKDRYRNRRRRVQTIQWIDIYPKGNGGKDDTKTPRRSTGRTP
jgi:hypothetical protein